MLVSSSDLLISVLPRKMQLVDVALSFCLLSRTPISTTLAISLKKAAPKSRWQSLNSYFAAIQH